MRNRLLLCCLLFLASLPASASPYYFTAAEWAQPRTGSALVQHPALAQVMRQLGEGQRLQLLYPGGDAGSLWAAELQAWLVALGLGSERIECLPGSSREDAIELRLIEGPAPARVAGPPAE